MEKQEIVTEKRSGGFYSQAVKGLLSGFLSCLPFFSTGDLKRLLRVDDERGFSSYLSSSLPFLLLSSLSAVCFFYIPISHVLEISSIGIYIGLFFFCSLFLLEEVFYLKKDVQNKENSFSKWHIFASVLIFLSLFSLLLGLSFVQYGEVEAGLFPFIILFILLVSSFLCSFSGVSPASLFFILGWYLNSSEYLFTTLHEGVKSVLFLFVIFFLAVFSGNAFYKFFQEKLDTCLLEKRACSLAIYSVGAIVIASNCFEGPFIYESTSISELAQKITIGVTITAFILVALALIIPHLPKVQIKIKVKKLRIKRKRGYKVEERAFVFQAPEDEDEIG